MASGQFRFIGWAVPPKSVEAHAFPEHGMQFSPLCGDVRYRWDVRAVRVRATDHDVPALCVGCIAVVTDAREAMGREVNELVDARRGQLAIGVRA